MDTAGELAFLPERTCAICYQDQNPTLTSESEIMAVTSTSGGIVGSAQTDVTNPYETIPCVCVYCFVCLATRLEGEEGEGWTCLRCGEQVTKCRPWAGDIVEFTEKPGKKSVGFSPGPDPKNIETEQDAAVQESAKESDEHVGSRWAGDESDSGIDVSAR